MISSNTMFTKESKTLLAKLMSEEDITVEHQNVETAMFDVKHRILTLPVWKDMSEELYDLLVGHEVAHALFTPAGEESLTEASARSSHGFVNVIEDARIEKLQKQKFAGLRTAFIKGYQELWDKDFFGVKDVSPSKINLIDRINIWFKVSAAQMLVESDWFNEDELHWVRKIEKLKTFDEVADLAEELYNFLKDNKEDNQTQTTMTNPILFDADESDEETQDTGSDNSEESGDMEGGENSNNNDTSEETSETETEDESDTDDMNDGVSEVETVSVVDNDELESKTDDALQQGLKTMVSTDSRNNFKYANITPIKNLSNHVVHWKTVSVQLENQFNVDSTKNLYEEFLKENQKTISYLVKEFEMKKAARAAANSTSHKSGNINSGKLWSYQINEDIFQRKVVVPEGKNHGMVMLVDWSGSMHGSMYSTMKQTITLATFCRRVGIAFDVFSFSDNPAHWNETKSNEDFQNYLSSVDINSWIPKKEVALRNLLSSEMNNQNFKKNANLLLQLTRSMDTGYGWCRPNLTYDDYCTTPLNDSLLILHQHIPVFVKKSGVEKVNMVVLTDGGDNGTSYVLRHSSNDKYLACDINNYPWRRRQQIIRDKIHNKILVHNPDGGQFTSAMVEHMRDCHNMNAIGFMLCSNKRELKYAMENYVAEETIYSTKSKELMSNGRKKIRENGFVSVTNAGYNNYFIIQPTDTKDENLNVNSSMTKSQVVRNFAKHNKSKKTNRQLLNKFVELVK